MRKLDAFLQYAMHVKDIVADTGKPANPENVERLMASQSYRLEETRKGMQELLDKGYVVQKNGLDPDGEVYHGLEFTNNAEQLWEVLKKSWNKSFSY